VLNRFCFYASGFIFSPNIPQLIFFPAFEVCPRIDYGPWPVAASKFIAKRTYFLKAITVTEIAG
jgi:hypothetical protein